MCDFEKLCNEYRENKRMIEELTALNEELKAKILLLMGENDTMVQGATKVVYKLVNSTRLDSKALKADLPEVFEKYSVDSSYKRFMVS